MRKIIFIRSYHRDLEWLRYCLASINKFVTGFDGVVVAGGAASGTIDEVREARLPLTLCQVCGRVGMCGGR